MVCYRYQALEQHDSLRLLILFPATRLDDPLRGSIIHTTLSACDFDLIEKYTALSYVWGDPARVGTILLDDIMVHITANLADALRDLRDMQRPQRVWADAICINQDDVSERNCQVAMMGRIYSEASNTIIYLGHITPEAKLVFDAVAARQRISVTSFPRETAIQSSKINSEDLSLEVVSPEDLAPEDLSLEDLPPGEAEGLVDAMQSDILLRPWFHRVWVFQEAVLSKEPWLLCGKMRLRWQTFCGYLIPLLRASGGKGMGSSLVTMNAARLGKHNRKLLQLLLNQRRCKVTDPRDMIYAHMGVVSDLEMVKRFIQVDYNQSIENVLRDTARYGSKTISLSSTIDTVVEEVISNSRSQETPLPLWAPTWGLVFPSSAKPPSTSICGLACSVCTASLNDIFAIGSDRWEDIIYTSNTIPPPSAFSSQFKSRVNSYHLYLRVARLFSVHHTVWENVRKLWEEFTRHSTGVENGETSPSSAAAWIPLLNTNEKNVSTLCRHMDAIVFMHEYLQDDAASTTSPAKGFCSVVSGNESPPVRLGITRNNICVLLPDEARCGDAVCVVNLRLLLVRPLACPATDEIDRRILASYFSELTRDGHMFWGKESMYVVKHCSIIGPYIGRGAFGTDPFFMGSSPGFIVKSLVLALQ